MYLISQLSHRSTKLTILVQIFDLDQNPLDHQSNPIQLLTFFNNLNNFQQEIQGVRVRNLKKKDFTRKN